MIRKEIIDYWQNIRGKKIIAEIDNLYDDSVFECKYYFYVEGFDGYGDPYDIVVIASEYVANDTKKIAYSFGDGKYYDLEIFLRMMKIEAFM